MKLEKVTMKNKSWILEEIEDANKPTKVEPEKLEPVLTDKQKALAKREEEIKKIIAKRLEATKKVAEETKGEDHAILGKDIKVKETLCKGRKEVGTLIESLKEKGINFFVKKINEGENRYKVIYNPLTEKTLKENDCDNIDIEALEWYVKNYSEGDNITVTADLLNVLEQSLEMYKKHCGKEVKEDVNSEIDAVKYWTNEVLFQIDEYAQNHELKELSNEEKTNIAKDIAYDIVYNSDNLWSYINDTIRNMIDDATYVPSNESLNESRYANLSSKLAKAKEKLKELKIKLENAPDDESREDLEISIDICQNDINNIEGELAEIRYVDNGSTSDYSGYESLDESEVKEDSKIAKKPVNKKISNPIKQIKEKSHKGPFEIEYWVDEEARDMGFGDIYLEIFDDLEEAKEVADSLFGEVASVEVLDADGQVVYGRYPEDESFSKNTIKEEDEVVYVVTELGNDMGTFDSEDGAIKFAKEHNHQQVEKRFKDDLDGDYDVVWSNEKFESLKEEDEVASVEYCVMDELDNNIECFEKEEEAIEWAKDNGGFRVLEVSYGPRDEYGDEEELGCVEIWALEDEDEIEESKKEKKFAKKVMKPGVQFDDDDMNASVSVNESEAHALIGDKPIVEEGKSEIDIANDFSSTVMNNDALKSLEDDDNI